MPSSPGPGKPAQRLLDEAEAELRRRLRDACEAEERGVSTESSDEIRRLEDSLLAAAMAAERTLAARELKRASSGAADSSTANRAPKPTPDAPAVDSRRESTEATTSDADASESTSVREFADETGKAWRAWPVIPDPGRAHAAARPSLGAFQDGWICFEALDNSGRRRLPRPGRRWSDLPAEDLPRLLAEAITVQPRKSRQADSASSPHRRDAN